MSSHSFLFKMTALQLKVMWETLQYSHTSSGQQYLFYSQSAVCFTLVEQYRQTCQRTAHMYGAKNLFFVFLFFLVSMLTAHFYKRGFCINGDRKADTGIFLHLLLYEVKFGVPQEVQQCRISAQLAHVDLCGVSTFIHYSLNHFFLHLIWQP